MPWDRARRVARAAAASAVALCALGAANEEAVEAEQLRVTGKIVYGEADGARRAAEVDILAVYANNPIYMRMKAEGLSETDGERGSKLFTEARASTNRALATVALDLEVDVMTVPGGVSGGDFPIPDLTQKVIDTLPIYHVDGKVIYGNAANARLIAELDSAALLAAIPAWREAQKLTPNDANFHLLRKRAHEQFEAAVKKAAADGHFEAVAERGAVTCRLGPVADITPAAMAALES